ncbi:MAG: hypothetical protein DIZ80_08725 [endosymbiont of Galathealinum brachiosum]|uniref:Uncharacterized protein n=1 Tax=endosymbiont of Galathealinum brachiosum TaxID=2200906 RepID=A0A370DBT5_9GAMM|nr:MAG: hypothetical protein DIZ80_08725 [endosymbiont of Galathealinum brachiosum]
MPYYVYKVGTAELAMLKQLELINTFEKFKEAKNFARDARADLTETDTAEIKVMFADNQLAAEEMLMETRDKPIVMEHEK